VRSWLKSQSSRSAWQKVFFLAAGIYVVGAIIFVIFGSGERQNWAESSDDKRQKELGDFLSDNKRHTNEKQADDVAI